MLVEIAVSREEALEPPTKYLGVMNCLRTNGDLCRIMIACGDRIYLDVFIALSNITSAACGSAILGCLYKFTC